TSPWANCLAKWVDELSSVTASATRRDVSSVKSIFFSRASSAKLLARSASRSARAASTLSAITEGLSRRAESTLKSDNAAGSSCPRRIEPACRAYGHATARSAAVTATLPIARLSRPDFIKKPKDFAWSKVLCPSWDSTAPTKEGLLLGGKIVSNLYEQISGARIDFSSDRRYGRAAL